MPMLDDTAATADAVELRPLFHALLSPWDHPEVIAPAATLAREGLERAGAGAEEGSEALAHSAAQLVADARTRAERAAGETCERIPRALHAHALRQVAPLLAAARAWLRELSNVSVCHLAHAAGLTACTIALEDAPGEYAIVARALRGLGAELHDPRSALFSQDPDVDVRAFELPVLLLGMAPLHRASLPELLGVCLGYPATIARAAASRLLDRVDPGGAARLRAADETLTREALGCARALALRDRGDDLRRRFWSRVARGLRAVTAWSEPFAALLRELEEPFDPVRRRVAAVLAAKAPFARGYHGGRRLAGRTFDEWLAAAAEPLALVDALAASQYVVPGDASASPFFREAVRPHGGMAGVFSPEELEVLRAWIDALPSHAPPARVRRPAEAAPERVERTPACARPRVAAAAAHAALEVRELFHGLVNVDVDPQVVVHGRRHVEHVLRAAAAEVTADDWAVTPDALWPRLQAWYRAQFERQLTRAGAEPAPPRDRSAFALHLLQDAPFVLMDGAWLQTVASRPWHQDTTRALLRIWWDEVGGGDPARNHAVLYRSLLASAGWDLPELTSRRFVEVRELLDSAFEAPAFLLGMSYMPSEFLPEFLGVNLAVEISGVGVAFRRLAELARRFGLDPHVFELHDSIDNGASGHSAVALGAVLLEVERTATRDGATRAAEALRRVLVGYRAFSWSRRRLNAERVACVGFRI
ncbi:MAG TPA: iron-containing redox enzyme family protein [Gemmatimonadaceae bacterium]|nr:iron-containing redox enzyme family protein [Gemmatimonadaceae bacterium]